MNNFIYENGTKIIFGGGCIKEYLARCVHGYGSHVLLVTDGGAALSGAWDEVARILRAEGKTAEEHTVCTPCPDCGEGLSMRPFLCHLLIQPKLCCIQVITERYILRNRSELPQLGACPYNRNRGRNTGAFDAAETCGTAAAA